MKLRADPRADALYLRLDEAPIRESAEVAPGIVLDYDAEGRIVAIEMLDVAKRLPAARLTNLEFEVAGEAPPPGSK